MDLAGFAGALRGVAARCEGSLALDCAHEAGAAYIEVLQAVTPKRSGNLAASEHLDSVSGSGVEATATGGPHIIYAKFRDEGGTINAKYGEVWKTVKGKSRMYRHTLHWDGGGFPLHVTQAGSHYMSRAEAAARPAIEAACQRTLDGFIHL